jgi:hypothetical protein
LGLAIPLIAEPILTRLALVPALASRYSNPQILRKGRQD